MKIGRVGRDRDALGVMLVGVVDAGPAMVVANEHLFAEAFVLSEPVVVTDIQVIRADGHFPVRDDRLVGHRVIRRTLANVLRQVSIAHALAHVNYEATKRNCWDLVALGVIGHVHLAQYDRTFLCAGSGNGCAVIVVKMESRDWGGLSVSVSDKPVLVRVKPADTGDPLSGPLLIVSGHD